MLKKERVKVNIYYIINTRNRSISHNILQLPLKFKVLIQREKKEQTKLYKIKSIKGNNIILELKNRLIRLRYIHIKPYYYIGQTRDQKAT